MVVWSPFRDLFDIITTPPSDDYFDYEPSFHNASLYPNMQSCVGAGPDIWMPPHLRSPINPLEPIILSPRACTVNDIAATLGALHATGHSGRNDPHGREAGENIKEQLRQAEQQLQDLIQNQGSKKDKVKLRSKIENLKKQIERIEKGETHHRR